MPLSNNQRSKLLQDDCYAQMLPEYAAKTFCVSKHAALIRLEKLTAIVGNGYVSVCS